MRIPLYNFTAPTVEMSFVPVGVFAYSHESCRRVDQMMTEWQYVWHTDAYYKLGRRIMSHRAGGLMTMTEYARQFWSFTQDQWRIPFDPRRDGIHMFDDHTYVYAYMVRNRRWGMMPKYFIDDLVIPEDRQYWTKKPLRICQVSPRLEAP